MSNLKLLMAFRIPVIGVYPNDIIEIDGFPFHISRISYFEIFQNSQIVY